jgi:YD repeat-containing protein
MIRKLCALLFTPVVAIVCLTFSPGASAQVSPSCWTTVVCALYSLGPESCQPALPAVATAANCMGVPYQFETMCKVLNASCSPPPETCGCDKAGGPISLSNGNTYIIETDVKLPGPGGGLMLARTWNSLWPPKETAFQIGLFGPNWRSSFEERVFVGSDGYMKYARGNGSFWSFGFIGYNGVNNYGVAAPANITATLSEGATYWTLTFQSGEQRLFDNASGALIAIIDRNGNTTQLSYDSIGRLTTVTDPASRHLYFSYGNGSSSVVTAVTSNFGVSASYAYDNQGRLIQVTEPDNSTLSFQFDSNSLITAVLDSNGKVLESHTYDSSGRGLTSSRANGVDAVTITYQ